VRVYVCDLVAEEIDTKRALDVENRVQQGGVSRAGEIGKAGDNKKDIKKNCQLDPS